MIMRLQLLDVFLRQKNTCHTLNFDVNKKKQLRHYFSYMVQCINGPRKICEFMQQSNCRHNVSYNQECLEMQLQASRM